MKKVNNIGVNYMKNLTQYGKILFILSYILLIGGIVLSVIGIIKGTGSTLQAFQPLFITFVGFFLMFVAKMNKKK